MSPEGRAAFMEQMTLERRTALCEANNWLPTDLQVLLDNIHASQLVLFYSWVMQSHALEAILTQGDLAVYEDRGGHLQHQLSKEYQSFISPFLANALLRHAGKDMEKTKKAFTFVELLDHDHAALVETQLFADIRDRVKTTVNQMDINKTETDLLAELQVLCSDDVLFCVNHLSRSMYASRLEYVDNILGFIRAKACSVRLANWLLKRLELIRLNKEHLYKIEDLRKELASGELQVRNSLEIRHKKFHPGKMLLYTFLLAAALFLAYVIVYKPFSEVDPILVADDTSFEQFSVDERKRIDSLLREMNGNRDEDGYLDAGAIFSPGTALSLRKAFLNESLERIYEDFALDAQLQAQSYGDSCHKSIPYTALEGTADLTKYNGGMEAMFRNESAYDIIVLVGNNRTGGSVYSAFVPRGEVVKTKLEEGDILLIIAGLTFQTYKRPGGVAPSEMPSSAFKHHFCNTDFNYAETMNTPYEVSRRGNGKCKFLISGSRGDYVDLVDVSGVLEPW